MSNMEKLVAIYRDVLKKPDLQLKPELTARDVDSWDSLAHVQIIVEVEKNLVLSLIWMIFLLSAM